MIQNIFFCDDIWFKIKQYVFPKHLWNIPEIHNYNTVIRNLPNIKTSPLVLNIRPLLYVSQNLSSGNFIKIHENVLWNRNNIRNNILIISYVFVSDINIDEFLFNNSCYYDYYINMFCESSSITTK